MCNYQIKILEIKPIPSPSLKIFIKFELLRKIVES